MRADRSRRARRTSSRVQLGIPIAERRLECGQWPAALVLGTPAAYAELDSANNAEIDELVAAIDGMSARPEALAQQGIITPLVFCRRLGQPIRTFWKRWRTACEAAGCPGRIPHDFRRAAVRNLNRAGVVETVAMKMTGHKTRSVFDRYDITSEEDLADASRKCKRWRGQLQGQTRKRTPMPCERRCLSL